MHGPSPPPAPPGPPSPKRLPSTKPRVTPALDSHSTLEPELRPCQPHHSSPQAEHPLGLVPSPQHPPRVPTRPGGAAPWAGQHSPTDSDSCPPDPHLDLDLIRELFGEAQQLPGSGVQGLDHHPQPGAALCPAEHIHGKVVLRRQPERRLQQTEPNVPRGPGPGSHTGQAPQIP